VDVSGVYVFGSPRVGDIGFRDRYQTDAQLWDKTFRWVKNDDFASKWPDYALGIPVGSNRYYHVGRLNFIALNNQVTMNHQNPEYEPGPELSIGDHDYVTTVCSCTSAFPGTGGAAQPAPVIWSKAMCWPTDSRCSRGRGPTDLTPLTCHSGLLHHTHYTPCLTAFPLKQGREVE
jgi:hypothetical protein